MSYELRPLSLAELLDRAFSIYRRHFLLFVGIMALPSLVMLVGSVGMQFTTAPVASPAPGVAPDPAQMIGAAAWSLGTFIVMMILYWITYAVALGASTAAVSNIYKGQVPSIAFSYGSMRGRMGRLAWLLLQVFLRLFGVFMLIGIIAAVLAGGFAVFSPILAGVAVFAAMGVGVILFCWMALRYSIVVPPAVLEDSTAGESIARSIDLTRGHLWRVGVLVVFTIVIGYAALMLFQGPFFIASVLAGPETSTGFWLNMCGVITGSIGSGLTSPLAVVAMGVLYYDLRIRKEGLDLEVMIAGLRGDDHLAATPPDGRGVILPG